MIRVPFRTDCAFAAAGVRNPTLAEGAQVRRSALNFVDSRAKPKQKGAANVPSGLPILCGIARLRRRATPYMDLA